MLINPHGDLPLQDFEPEKIGDFTGEEILNDHLRHP
jgi:hypothetical protein